jgi:hypothetical protein
VATFSLTTLSFVTQNLATFFLQCFPTTLANPTKKIFTHAIKPPNTKNIQQKTKLETNITYE